MDLALVMSGEELMADKRAKRVEEKVCPACGCTFVPRQLGGGSRMYCYEPDCEMKRDRDRKKRYRARKKKKKDDGRKSS